MKLMAWAAQSTLRAFSSKALGRKLNKEFILYHGTSQRNLDKMMANPNGVIDLQSNPGVDGHGVYCGTLEVAASYALGREMQLKVRQEFGDLPPEAEIEPAILKLTTQEELAIKLPAGNSEPALPDSANEDVDAVMNFDDSGKLLRVCLSKNGLSKFKVEPLSKVEILLVAAELRRRGLS